MTKRDYELIAAVMLYSRPEGAHAHDDGRDTWERAVNEFVRVLKGSNARFDEARFRKACGM